MSTRMALLQQLVDFFQFSSGNLRKSALAPTSSRLSRTLLLHDISGEKLISITQAGVAIFILLLHLFSQSIANLQTMSYLVVCALAGLAALSILRLRLSHERGVNERLLDLLTVTDIGILLLLIWSYQFAYDHPAGASLKAPTFFALMLLIGLRALRFHPRPIIVAGAAAIVGWGILVSLAINTDGTEAITRGYSVYLTSYKILIGAEVEKIAALLGLTTVLAIATARARRILTEAAHGKDYSEALSEARKNLECLSEARHQTNNAIAELEKQRRELAVQNDRFNSLLTNMGEGVCMFDGQKRLVVCNDRYAEWYQLPHELLKAGTPHDDIIAHRVSNGILRGETDKKAVKSKISALARHSESKSSSRVDQLWDGRYICVTRQPLPGGGWVATHADVTEQHQSAAKISHMALHDALTNLPNRTMFSERLEHALKRVGRGEVIAIHLLDLDHFKNVNDTLGHPIGDLLLKAVGQRLRKHIREIDTIARMGGDEFAIIQVSVGRPEDIEALAERIVRSVSEPYEIDGHQVVVGASIGIAVGPTDGVRAETLIRNADLALYRAKANGRGALSFFEQEMDEKMQARRTLEFDFRKGLATNDFELHYQPLIRANDRKIGGFEALVRWRHPARGIVSPAEFIPLAEETGLILQLGEWIIYEACTTAAVWPEHLRVAVNLSPVQFRKPGLLEIVISALETSGLSPDRLELEITESVLLEKNSATLDTLRQLQELGVRIAMDDFGTGYSSLSYLRSFPFDKIKIDRSFVKDLNEESGSLNIVRAVVTMAKSMGISTTAEGVETEEQLSRVSAEGCTEIQGYLFGKPVPAWEIEERFIASERARSLEEVRAKANGRKKPPVRTA